MEFVEGDKIKFVMEGSNYVITFIIGKTKRAKKNILSVEDDLTELTSRGSLIGMYKKPEIEDLITNLKGEFIPKDQGNNIIEQPNWFF
jgi:hypothetical protein